jgi:hypothetical protein
VRRCLCVVRYLSSLARYSSPGMVDIVGV